MYEPDESVLCVPTEEAEEILQGRTGFIPIEEIDIEMLFRPEVSWMIPHGSCHSNFRQLVSF